MKSNKEPSDGGLHKKHRGSAHQFVLPGEIGAGCSVQNQVIPRCSETYIRNGTFMNSSYTTGRRMCHMSLHPQTLFIVSVLCLLHLVQPHMYIVVKDMILWFYHFKYFQEFVENQEVSHSPPEPDTMDPTTLALRWPTTVSMAIREPSLVRAMDSGPENQDVHTGELFSTVVWILRWCICPGFFLRSWFCDSNGFYWASVLQLKHDVSLLENSTIPSLYWAWKPMSKIFSHTVPLTDNKCFDPAIKLLKQKLLTLTLILPLGHLCESPWTVHFQRPSSTRWHQRCHRADRQGDIRTWPGRFVSLRITKQL